MSLLLVALPPGAPGAYPYALSRDGGTVAGHGVAAPALLPPAPRGTEVVALVPARLLSWHRVALPKGVGPGSPRLAAVLAGLLEERLLDDPEQLHFALAPDARAGEETRAVVCDKSWLTAHLKALEAAGRPVGRIVPQAEPRTGEAPQALVTGKPGSAELILTGGALDGVQALPLPDGADTAMLAAQLSGLLPGLLGADAANAEAQALDLLADPPVAQQAEQLFQRPARLVTPAARWLATSRSRWDLAQLELAQSNRARAVRRLAALWRDLLHAPLWRPARWGVALVVLLNLIGLNALAWHEKSDLAARHAQIAATLTATFPQVQVVVDAPVQMAREVAQLRQTTGSASPRDLEPMLAAWAAVPDAHDVPAAIEYSPGQLRLTGIKLSDGQIAQANERLRPLGYRLATESDATVLHTLDETS